MFQMRKCNKLIDCASYSKILSQNIRKSVGNSAFARYIVYAK